MRSIPVLIALLAAMPQPVLADCGGDFNKFINDLKSEAIALGHGADTVNAFFAPIRQDPRVIKADRAQGVFKKSFIDFSQTVISKNRLDHGRNNAKKYAEIFSRIESEHGISKGVLLAFWALETDYGAVQGDASTPPTRLPRWPTTAAGRIVPAPDPGRDQLFERGDFDPAGTTGAWAGRDRQVQMLPDDILRNGVDGDGDGHVRLKTSAADALMRWQEDAARTWLAAGRTLAAGDHRACRTRLGADRAQSRTDDGRVGTARGEGALGALARGLRGSVLLPMGRKGPAFIAYPNFRVYFEWNKSFVYVTTAAYFATRLEGAPVYDPGNPEPGLGDKEMKALQTKLAARGHDVGKIDGILGERTREAVHTEQSRLGLPADAWPTRALLDRL